MDVIRIAAFSDGEEGGNPAGVVLTNRLPDEPCMQKVAAEVGFSETAFAAPLDSGWRVRYFSPESEVPFCGHATISLGAALAMRMGNGVFPLALNNADISVEGTYDGTHLAAALQSPPTQSGPLSRKQLADALRLFGYSEEDLDPRLPPARIHGGADHLLLALRSRATLTGMRYDLESGRQLMMQEGLVTILLAHAESSRIFHARNAFASGGVYEDPATGAAAAALAGYLRDIGWPHGGEIDIIQGQDMGARSLLRANIPEAIGSSIRVSGKARILA